MKQNLPRKVFVDFCVSSGQTLITEHARIAGNRCPKKYLRKTRRISPIGEPEFAHELHERTRKFNPSSSCIFSRRFVCFVGIGRPKPSFSVKERGSNGAFTLFAIFCLKSDSLFRGQSPFVAINSQNATQLCRGSGAATPNAFASRRRKPRFLCGDLSLRSP